MGNMRLDVLGQADRLDGPEPFPRLQGRNPTLVRDRQGELSIRRACRFLVPLPPQPE
jgi:hypothetical protein